MVPRKSTPEEISLNSYTIGSHQQTQKLELHFMSPNLTLGVKGLKFQELNYKVRLFKRNVFRDTSLKCYLLSLFHKINFGREIETKILVIWP